MPGFIAIVYLSCMFIAMYFFFFYIILIVRNGHRMFDYPKASKAYSVSVLVAGYNEEKTIGATINHIMDSDYPLEEVIVINDGSTDGTAGVVRGLQKKYENLRFLDKKQNSGKADSLNQGIKMAKGEMIAIVDADSYPEKESIGKIVGFFNDKQVAAVTSAVFVRNKKNFITKLQSIEYIVLAWTRKLFDFIGAVYVTNGPLSIYRKKGLEEVGGFDTKTVTEDIELTWHLLSRGYKAKMCLSAFVTTTAPTTLRQWWRQRERWGIGGLQAIYKYRKTFLKKGMLGFFVIPFVSFSIILSIGVFIFGVYIVSRKFLMTYLSAKYSYLANTYIFNLQDINLHPSVLIFFTVVIFVVSFTYSRHILKVLGKEKGEWDDVKKLFNRLFYLLVYLALYPLVWFSAIYRITKKDYRW